MRSKLLYTSCLVFLLLGFKTAQDPADKKKEFIAALISKMTLEEKAGQLNLIIGDLFNTGPTVRTTESDKFNELIRKGEITGIFNIHGAEYIGKLQKIAVEESRLGIPLLIGADIIHGFKTVSPIPLAEAASWDLAAIEASAALAARESAAAGINWTFAPMVDICRDPRWGRVAEGAGEDPYLGSLIAAARVRGFQGKSLADANTIAACAKHFAAYGAAEGGRDYNTVDMSIQRLRETYLPPFKAALDAGVATFMTSFNELNGVPASGNKMLLEDILRKEWGFGGMVVSDWQSINEMMAHGYVANEEEAGISAFNAGTDMDMMGDIYLHKLPDLVRRGVIDIKLVDQAVERVLAMKYDLGLFDNPYQYSNPAVEKSEVRNATNLAVARDMAKKSIVLLKNEKQTLPLEIKGKTIALIGPLADDQAEHNGCWSFFGEPQHVVSVEQGIREAYGKNNKIVKAHGCTLYKPELNNIKAAVETAKKADYIVLAVGEGAVMNGEAGSRSDIRLPQPQEELLKQLSSLGKPLIVLVFAGRPLDISWIEKHADAVLYCWTLGSETGHAVADVLSGQYNPAGRLPMSFPYNVGQVPVYYNYKHTGRPYTGNHSEPASERVYRSRYIDVPNAPRFPFGFGLSYTSFSYGAISIDKTQMTATETVKCSVVVENTGKYTGEEVVQLYMRDMTASITRPVKELKGFQKIKLAPGAKQTVVFELKASDLAFWKNDHTFGTEPGKFLIYLGPNAATETSVSLELLP